MGLCVISTTVVEHVSSAHNTISSELRKVDPLLLLVGTVGGTVVFLKVAKLYSRSEECLFKRLAAFGFAQLRRIPAVKARIEKELSGAKKEILETIHKDDTDKVSDVSLVISDIFRRRSSFER